jgi:hypothetical protein
VLGAFSQHAVEPDDSFADPARRLGQAKLATRHEEPAASRHAQHALLTADQGEAS